MSGVLAAAHAWLALVLICGALGATVFAAMARTLYVLVLALATSAALAAVALLALSAGDAGVTAALIGVGVAPFLLLATLLLTTRAAKASRARPPWLAIGAAVVVTLAIAASLPDLSKHGAASEGSPIAMWLAPLVLIAAIAAMALLGFGERGALDHAPAREE